MAEVYIKPEEVKPADARNVLSFLNSAKSAKEIATTVEILRERDVGDIVAQHILDKRKTLGKFTNLKQVADVKGVGPERFTEIVTTLRGETTRVELFSLTPLKPGFNTEDQKALGIPCVNAYMYTFGGFTYNGNPYKLSDQYQKDEIFIGYDAVPLSNEVLPGDCQKNCGIQVLFTAFNIDEDQQYELVFELRAIDKDLTAQIFVDHKLEDKAELKKNKPEQHLTPIRCEGKVGKLVNVWVRPAASDWRAIMGFKAVDCAII